ncbi:MAG: hypothetical protein ABWW66_05805 [Archaeoglobaceae archaeon]
MKKLELYTLEDLERDLNEGYSDTEVALKKWRKILEALKAIEEVSVQITSFCLRYQKVGCEGCPILRYDYPCGHPYAAFTVFFQDLRRLIFEAERIYAILMAIDKDDKDARQSFV